MAKRWEAKFLSALEETANVAESARLTGIGRATAYRERKENPDFAAKWDTALQLGMDSLIDEAVRRARDGTTKPVYQGGKLVGYVQEYSDTLMIFLLKAHDPARFRDNVDITSGGKPLKLIVSWANSEGGDDDD